MKRTRGITLIVGIGICAVLTSSSAWAESSPFVGRWHWNATQSTVPPGEPPASDVVSEISRADGVYVTWSITIVTPDGQPHVAAFDAAADGEFHPISTDTTAAARLNGNTLEVTAKGLKGFSDTQTCTVSADLRQMTCRGVLTDEQGRTASYVDVYDRMEKSR